MGLMLAGLAALIFLSARNDAYFLQLLFVVLWGLLGEWVIWGLLRRRRWAWLAAQLPFAFIWVPALFFMVLAIAYGEFVGFLISAACLAVFVVPTVLLFSCRAPYMSWVAWATEPSPLGNRARGHLANALRSLERGETP